MLALLAFREFVTVTIGATGEPKLLLELKVMLGEVSTEPDDTVRLPVAAVMLLVPVTL